MSTLLFLYFRYVARSPWREHNDTPWPDGVGQSWSQYKLMTWASFPVIGGLAALAAGVVMRSRSLLLRGVLAVVLTVWCGTGLGWNFKMVLRRGESQLVDSGASHEPLNACLAMRETVLTLPADDWIYLDWPKGERQKYREQLVYFLSDRHLASDWSDDGYIAPYVTPADARRTPADCAWILHYRPPQDAPPGGGPAPAPGGLTLERSKR